MRKIQTLFLILLPLLYFSQVNNLTTSEAYYPVISSSKYEKKISKNNEGTIFFEFYTKQITLTEKDCYVKSGEYFMASIINGSKIDANFTLQDGSLFIIQEAQNKNGEWTPIEHWTYSTCGNSYDNELILSPKTYASFPFKLQKGDFKTKIRFKMKDLRTKKIYYSESFDGQIDPAKFKDSEWKKPDRGHFYNVSHFDEKP